MHVAPCARPPGIGLAQYHHGVVCAVLNRPEEALARLQTAERLVPGSPLLSLAIT